MCVTTVIAHRHHSYFIPGPPSKNPNAGVGEGLRRGEKIECIGGHYLTLEREAGGHYLALLSDACITTSHHGPQKGAAPQL
jgi:hypothetical protein